MAAYVPKLGTAAPWFTALVSAEMFALEDDPEPLEDVAELCGVELEEVELELPGLLDDEHAASSVAAPIAVTPNAMRDARGILPSLKLLMRPRICLKEGPTRP